MMLGYYWMTKYKINICLYYMKKHYHTQNYDRSDEYVYIHVFM